MMRVKISKGSKWLPMTMMIVVAAAARLPRSTLAYSTGAGQCIGGQAAVGGAHLSSAAETGSLQDGAVSAMVQLGTGLTDLFELVEIVTANDYAIYLQPSEFGFRGALIRVSSPDGAEFTLDPDANDLEVSQVASACDGIDGVQGVTHTEGGFKFNPFRATLNVATTGTIVLDITVVRFNNRADGSVYHYSNHTLTVRESFLDGPAPTTVERAFPTASPLSPTPTSVAPAVITNSETAPTMSPPSTDTPITPPPSTATPIMVQNETTPTVAPTATPVVNETTTAPSQNIGGNETTASPQTDGTGNETMTPVDVTPPPETDVAGNETEAPGSGNNATDVIPAPTKPTRHQTPPHRLASPRLWRPPLRLVPQRPRRQRQRGCCLDGSWRQSW
jgi:hypothetical protein